MQTIETRAGDDVLVMGNGCRPASEAESAFYAEITRLRAEVEALTAQLQSGESFHAVAVRQRDAAWREVEALKAEDARLRKTGQKENDELVQILGKALRYPKFVDDQSVFPGATEADGVCVPCHTGVSIADEAAAAIEALRADAERWRYINERNGEWRRFEADGPDPAYSMLCVRLPYDADLSCRATREIAIDAARAAQGEKS